MATREAHMVVMLVRQRFSRLRWLMMTTRRWLLMMSQALQHHHSITTVPNRYRSY